MTMAAPIASCTEKRYSEGCAPTRAAKNRIRQAVMNEHRKLERAGMKNKATFSSMAAALGSRGGKASKRKPGKLRCILLEICNELGSQENHAVFRYWQVHSMAATADNSSGDTCWFKYSLHAKPKRNYDHWLD